MITAIVFYNEDTDFWGGYKPGDRLVKEMTFSYEDMPEGGNQEEYNLKICEAVFMHLNRDDRPNGKTNRSMSVGDVVEIRYDTVIKRYSCDRYGFRYMGPPGYR